MEIERIYRQLSQDNILNTLSKPKSGYSILISTPATKSKGLTRSVLTQMPYIKPVALLLRSTQQADGVL